VSDDAMGSGGYLSERGLIPLPEDKLEQVQEAAINAAPMKTPSS
jgi:phosphate transport system substrate-binding protein